ncbi:MAG: CPBP family intramembrane glutamic endopeptidase [Candidatus Korobacteraceae bacterium]
MKNRKGIIAFLLIAFGIAWASWEAMYRLKATVPAVLLGLLMAPAVFAPAIACFVVRKWITREGFADAGLRLHLRKWPYYLVSWLLPLPVMACVVVLAPMFGAGTADFSMGRGIKYMASFGKPLPAWAPHSLVLLTGIFLMEAVFAIPILFGEEFGWRGYLQKRLFPTKPVLSAVATGIIWGLWHLPLTLRGYGFADNPKIGAFLMYPLFCIIFSIVFGWLMLKTNSIWSCSLAHASTNAVGGSLSLILFGGGANFLYASYGGLLAMIPLGALSAWIVFTGQLKPANEVVSNQPLAKGTTAGNKTL